jgi:uncharacterized membrane protein
VDDPERVGPGRAPGPVFWLCVGHGEGHDHPAFLPFPTSLIGEFAGERVSVAIYAANAALASLLLVATSWYATGGRRLVPPDHNLEEEKVQRAQGLAVPVVFLASIGVFFFSPTAAMYSWLLLIFTDPIVRALWSR